MKARKTRKNKKRPPKRQPKQMECHQSKDHCQPTCSTTITEDPCSKRLIQVSWKWPFARQMDTPFLFSFSHLFNCFIDQKLTELSKIIGEEWKKLNDDQKKVRSSLIFYQFVGMDWQGYLNEARLWDWEVQYREENQWRRGIIHW